jgi:hypothetical protein
MHQGPTCWRSRAGRTRDGGVLRRASSGTEEKSLMAEFLVTPAGNHIALTIRDDNDQSVSVQADRYQSFAAILSIVQALESLPLDRKAPIHGQQPVLTSKNPSFQVGVTPNGGIMLTIRPDLFPPLAFEFDAQSVAKLINDLRIAARKCSSHEVPVLTKPWIGR